MLPALAQNLNIIGTNASSQASVFYLFIMIRQVVGLHVAYNTLCTDKKMHYTIGWDMASDMQYQ